MSRRLFKRFSIFVLFGWLLCFALIPFALVLIVSFLRTGEFVFFQWSVTLSSYQTLFNPIYLTVFLRSFILSSVTALICLLLGYPFAYILVKLPERMRLLALMLLIVPFWTSSLIRIYAVMIIMRADGLLNAFLLHFGVIHQPLQLLYTHFSVMFGLVYALLPFMVFPLYANFERFDWRLMDAARDLGANRWRALFRIVLPNTIPGIIAGIILVVLPAMTLFYIPDMLGGAKSLLLGNLIKDQFVAAHNWPLGSASSVILTVIMGVMLFIYFRVSTPKDRRDLLS